RRVDDCNQLRRLLSRLRHRFRPHRPRLWLNRRLARPQETLAETVDELAVGWREIVQETVDGLDDDAPLRESRHRAERIEPRLHFHRDADAQLRIVLDLLAFLGPSRRSTCATTFDAFLGHDRHCSYRTVEIRELRCVSDLCGLVVNTSENVMQVETANRTPLDSSKTAQNHDTRANRVHARTCAGTAVVDCGTSVLHHD